MSAYKKITCSFKNKEILVEALENINYKPIIYEDKQKLKGYQNDIRNESAEIIIPKQQISKLSNDIGFSFDNTLDEYYMVCSDYDLKSGVGDKIKQSYAITAIRSALKKNKFTVSSETKNKKVTLNASKII